MQASLNYSSKYIQSQVAEVEVEAEEVIGGRNTPRAGYKTVIFVKLWQ